MDRAIKCGSHGLYLIFVYFSAKINPETETEVLGRAKTETEFKIPPPPNTSVQTKEIAGEQNFADGKYWMEEEEAMKGIIVDSVPKNVF